MAKLYDTRLVGGKSAYNYAVEGGYSGTEEEFTQSLGEMGDIGITLTSTLVAGETTLVFSDNRITTDDVLNNVYTSKFGMSVKSAVFGEGTLTLEFPSQQEDITVKVVINAILSLGGNGLDGKDGADGKSAYEYAVEGGYTGTETEFAQLFNNMSAGGGEWTLAGSVTSTNAFILPTNFNELLIIVENTHSTFAPSKESCPKCFGIIPKQALSSTYEYYALSSYDGQCEVKANTTTLIFNNWVSNGNVALHTGTSLSYIKTTVYYR